MAGTRLALAALLLLLGGGGADLGGPPPALRCPLLDERGAPSPRPALLRVWGRHATPGPPQNPGEPPEGAFDVSDPWGALEGLWGAPGAPPRCELSPTAPLPPPGAGRARGEGTRWWLLSLRGGDREGTALLEGEGRRLGLSLSLSTLSPSLRALAGSPQTLHCALAPPPPGPFRLEWLRLGGGAARPLLAFDSRGARVTGAAPGALLLLGGRGGAPSEGGQPPGGALELSLRLTSLSLSDGGAFVCSVSTARGQLQQVLHLEVMAPPQVSLLPPELPPGQPVDLRCRAAGFSPLDVQFRWERRARGGRWRALGAGRGWSSGHRRAAGGAFSRSAGLRVTAAPGDSYGCRVAHPALRRPVRVIARVTDAIGPSVEDMAGMALVAFVIGGLCQRLWPPAGR